MLFIQEKATILGFADYLATVLADNLAVYATEAARTAKIYLKNVKLTLAMKGRRKQENLVCSTFRVLSDEAVLMVPGMITIDILTKEVSVLYHARHIDAQTERRNEARPNSHDLQQDR